MLANLAFHLLRGSSVLGWVWTQATNVLLVEGTPTSCIDISTAFQQWHVVHRSGERSAAQVADLRRCGIFSRIKRRACVVVYEGLNKGGGCSCRASLSFWLQLAGPSRSILNDCLWFERDYIREQYSGSPGQVRLNVALVAISFAWAHSNALQPRPVTPVNSKMSSSAQM